MANGSAYRRGSVFGALLLIAIGGLFLYANLHPEFSALAVVARYWPVLIIFWGLGKLMDYLMLRGRPEAVAATRITGGDIVGLIFLIILGTAFTKAVEHGWRSGPIVIGDEDVACLFGNNYDFTEELRQEITPPTTLTLSNLRGDVTLTVGSEDQIHLLGRKTVCAPSEAEAQELAGRVLPVLEESADGYNFHWEEESGATGLMTAALEVQVPRQMNLRLSGRRGDLQVSGVQGEVSVELERGDAMVHDIMGGVRVQIRSGDVNVSDVVGNVEIEGRGNEVLIRDSSGVVSLEGEFYGPIQFSSISGPTSFRSRRTDFNADAIDGTMTIDSGDLELRGVPGTLTVLTRNKDIAVDEVGGPIRIENRNGDIMIHTSAPPTSPIEVENSRGDIELVLPAASGFQLSATARNGEIQSDFAGPEAEEQRGGTQVMTGTAGGGGIPIRLTTSHGTISLRRSG